MSERERRAHARTHTHTHTHTHSTIHVPSFFRQETAEVRSPPYGLLSSPEARHHRERQRAFASSERKARLFVTFCRLSRDRPVTIRSQRERERERDWRESQREWRNGGRES